MMLETGIPEDSRKKISRGLAELLSDSYMLYVKTHNFHWNVTGPQFQTLHTMFEEQYTELAEAIDELAERIRALGEFAPGSFTEFSNLAEVKECSEVPSANEMIKNLVDSHETLIRRARTVIPIADEAHDEATADLVTARIQTHEKTAWMLRSLLG